MRDKDTSESTEFSDDRLASLLIAMDGASSAGFLREELTAFSELELPSAVRQQFLEAQRCILMLNLLFRTQNDSHGASRSDAHNANRFKNRTQVPTMPFVRAGRFEVQRQIGAGAMGVVYEVRDRERDVKVALKTLNQLSGPRILRFKQEFRRLTNVSHDNLVVLHELFQEGDDWFFTMELVDGVDFLTAIRELKDGTHSTEALSLPTGQRLCSLFRQLTEAISELHRAGIIHRDLKPSNVLVTPDDRVIVIDFGLATNFHWRDTSAERMREIAGTFAFMAPEQSAGEPASPSSDFYSVGVMLFQSFTGRLPFQGPLAVLSKQLREPPTISESIPQVSSIWNELCRSLMARAPADRPTGRELLDRLRQIERGIETTAVADLQSLPALSEVVDGTKLPFVGRQDQMEILRDAHRCCCDGESIVVSVQGTSGVGKTALVERFLDDLERHDTTVVLRGRCYERDSVPHKALDSLVDSLTQYLSRLPFEDLAKLLPSDIVLLARMFPVLMCTPSIAKACTSGEQKDPEPQALSLALRRRAFDALMDLLTNIATLAPLVLFIDDLHWGDSVGAIALANLIQSTSPTKLMLVIAFRREHVDDNECLNALGLAQLELVSNEALGSRTPVRSKCFKHVLIELAPLAQNEARDLAANMLAQHFPMSLGRNSEAAVKSGAEIENVIARESGGLPFFVHELVRHSFVSADKTNQLPPALSQNDSRCLDLNDVIWQRVQQLPESSRRLVETVAVAGHPIRLDLACAASLAKPIEGRHLNQLQVVNLLRSCGSGWRDNVTTFHDRIRESVVVRLSPETRREAHGRLATALESSDETDAETLAYHFDAANEIVRARHYYTLAAAAAQNVYAFERAVQLYQLALKLTPIADAHRLLCKLGEACGQAGRGGDGAKAFLAAAEIAPNSDKLELRLAAARQYCISGFTDEGRELLRDILATNGIRLHKHPAAILASLVSQRLRLWWRGLRFTLRMENTVDPAVIRKIDLIWDAASGLSFQEPVVMASLQTRGLLEALDAGEPKRLVRALSLEAILLATAGTRAKNRANAVLAKAHHIANQLADPVSRGMLCLGQGAAAFLQVRMPEATEALTKAEALFLSAAPKPWWELTTSRSLLAWAYMHMGDLQSLRHCVDAYLLDAEDRGDRFLLSSINSAGKPQLLLADNCPDEAQQRIDEITSRAPYERFQQCHVSLLFSQAQIDLYCNEGHTAWQRFHDNWPRLRRSMQIHNQFARVTMLELRARCALSAYQHDGNKSMLHHAKYDTARLKHEHGRWVRPIIDRLTAGISEADGDKDAAIASLQAAAIGFDYLGFRICSATARRRLGQLLGGEKGQQLTDSAQQILLGESVQCPEKLQLVYCY